MKIKSNIFVFLIIICILFSISTVSAGEIQADTIGMDSDYQSNIELNEDANSELISEICNDETNQDTEHEASNSINLDSEIYHDENEGIDDESSFTALSNAINQTEEEFNFTHDYAFNESVDSYELLDELDSVCVYIDKNKLVINGNNHILDGAGLGAEFNFENQNGEYIINDLTFKNFNVRAIFSTGKLTLNNVNFTGFLNSSEKIISMRNGNLTLNNCNFYSNHAAQNIVGVSTDVTVINSSFSGNDNGMGGIEVNRGELIIHNSTFENFTSKNGAMISYKGHRFELANTSFINSYSNLSGGAILAKYFPEEDESGGSTSYIPTDPILIKDCIFTNLSCESDGGAIHIDLDSASHHIKKTMNIVNSNFTDCRAKFGGAISILGGNLNISQSNFINNCAGFEGGAIYSSWTNLNISQTNIRNNNGTRNGGAIYFDKGKLTIQESNITGNKVLQESNDTANAIYAHDVEADFRDSTFDNGGIAVYADFASDSRMENVEKNDDIFLMDNHNYILSVENKGIKLNFTNNEIVVDSLPSRFDARDWGWTTPGKKQGDNDDCWAFATIASIETGLLKSTGVAYNLSQNYVQKLQLKYYEVGDLRNSLTGFSYSGLGYALSWYGVMPTDADYDDRGMILDVDMDVPRIHVQDAMFIYTGLDDTIDQLKRAIIKYGAVSVQYWLFDSGEEIETEGDDIALMSHSTHFISLIGWDDDLIKYDGDPKGIWITKDSLFGFSTATMTNLPEIDYYAIAPQRAAIAYIFENNIDYHVNYQTDLTGLAGFDENYTYYSNEFTSKYDELIGAVGTYFNESGINYSFDILVNNKTVHSQSGISEFAGFRTIALNKYIPIKKGDQFKVVFKSNAVPYQAWSRVHYLNGTSLTSNDGNSWTDFAPLNKTVCLKVYTLEIDDESSFTALARLIGQSEGEVNLTHDYRFNESIDSYFLLNDMGQMQVIVNKDKIVINGNNHIIDGAGGAASVYTKNPEGEIIFNDLTFKNFNDTALLCEGTVTLNNVNFTDFNNPEKNIISVFNGKLIADSCNFYSNIAKCMISGDYSNITVNNSNFTGNKDAIAIMVNRWHLIIHNSSFENFTSKNGAVINFKGDRFELVNSRFINAHSNLSGGAILAKYFPLDIGDYTNPCYIETGPIIIKDCEFTNLSCGNDGGAIHIDLDSASHHIPKIMNIIGSNFTDCRSMYGGAISILGGNLNISTSNFKNNYAGFEGGAIYSSWTNLSIANSNFKNNTGGQNAGALYFDKGKLTIKGSDFIGNKAIKESNMSANTIYAYDVEAYFSDSSFDNGGLSVYADFASDSKIENVEKNDDIFLMDNHNYIVSVESEGIKLNFTRNEIIVDTLPSRFDASDWGWTTPGKVQGDNDDCWAFATIASIETGLLKSTGVAYNLSQNYAQTLQLKYSEVGDLRNSLTGFSYSGLGYALSWYGVLPTDSDYDDRGMIRDTDMDVPRIHVQDAMFIYTGLDDTIDQLKRAIIKYGAVTVQQWVWEPEVEIPTEGEDIALMIHNTHFISLIGWDDNYTVDGNPIGAWITKDSLFRFGEVLYTNFPDIDYYAIVPQSAAIAYIFENDIDYHVNYQTDLTGLAGFDENFTFYSNEFTSKYDELIGAVGTYFNESGINYSFDVFVNNKKVHTQSGVSEFAGFKTIVLNKYIPIKKGEQFKVVFKSNAVPYQAWSRVHYMNGTSLVSTDGNSWTDFAPLNKTVCLKVYTVADDTKIINNKNLAVDYDGGSYFTVKIVTNDGRAVGAGESVKFTINGKSTTVKTDNNGMAKIKISELPGKYTITTTYRGKTYKNTVTVKQVLKASKANVKNTDSKLIIKATLKINGKAVKGKVIKFTFRGKTYKAKTNAKGIAQVTIKQSVIKKLTGKSYAVKVTYLKDTVKTTVTVKQVLKANKVTVKKSAKSFKLKASLKINGKVAKKKQIKFTLLKKTYKAKTNAKGIATVTIKQAVLKKLKKGKTYAVKVAYGKDYVKTSVKVKK